LIRSQRERERLAIPRDQLSGRAQGLCRRGLAGGGRPSERETEDEELVVGEPEPTDLRLRERSGAMDDGERVRAKRETLGGEQRRGNIVARVPNQLERPRVQIAELLLCDVLARRIDGGEVGGLRIAVEVVGRNGEAVPVRAPAQTDRGARDQLARQPRLVEPGCLDLARIVRDAGSEDLQPPSAPARGGANDSLDDRLLVAEEIADPLRRRGLLVPPRRLPEHVAHGPEPELREPTSERRPDAVEAL